jgi:hypothetical protein
MPKTTIWLEKSTREKLSRAGRHDQTYDDLINELLLLKESSKN